MDRSMDSIGSCSLDVDADSSDISDTSGSLNFPTPLSVKDITREFTANIRERCTVQRSSTVVPQQTSAIVDPISGQVRMVLLQPTAPDVSGISNLTNSTKNNNILPTAASAGSALDTALNYTTTTVAAQSSSAAAPEGGSGSSSEKKPSYLNLACCVNGYSNLTTYDSKIRQDINKSREVSPIRPSSQALQYCKKNNALAPPVLHDIMPNVSVTKQPLAGMHKYNGSTSNNNASYEASSPVPAASNGLHHENVIGNGNGAYEEYEERRNVSFIQQRVERLYGPGALAQGFYSPRKARGESALRVPEATSPPSSELSRKFQQLSPSKDYSEFRKKLGGQANSGSDSCAGGVAATAVERTDNNDIDLPCLRHLSQQFRAQLPSISPKRLVARGSPSREESQQESPLQPQDATPPLPRAARADEVDHVVPHPMASLDAGVDASAAAVPAIKHSTSLEITLVTPNEHTQPQIQHNSDDVPVVTFPGVAAPVETADATNAAADSRCSKNGAPKMDGNFFLGVLKREQARLLSMASDVEKYSDALANNPDISEDTLGFLRSASGKARLLVSQKMKQFEGLCHNNLNRSPEDKFPTTDDDLQGFWDMVYLQVDDVDTMFAEIQLLKRYDWKFPNELLTPKSTPQHKSNKTGGLRAKVNGAAGGNASAKKAATPLSAAALKRESQRKQLLEMKRKNRMAMATNNGATESSCNAVALDNTNSIEVFSNEKNSS